MNVGSPASICVGATVPASPPGPAGNAITGYTWELVDSTGTNWNSVYSSGTATCLSEGIPTAQLTDTGTYRVVVLGAYGSVTSSIVSLQVVGAGVVIGNGDGLRGNYFNLPTFTGGNVPPSWAGTPTLNRVDPTVAFDWVLGSPNPVIQTDYFAVRWYGQIQPLFSGSYQFTVRSDDGCRLWIDKTNLVINSWIPKGASDVNGTITLDTTKHQILLEYFEQAGNASVQLYWTNSGNISKTLVPVQQLFANQATWTPPSVQVTSPANGSVLPNPITLAANVTTNDGIVKYVEFYRGTTWLVTVTNPPYSASMTLPTGNRNIAAKVVYNESSWLSSVNTNTVSVIAVTPVTITMTPTGIQYTGGGGSQFVLMKTNMLTGPVMSHDGWEPIATNTSTPGTFTFPLTGDAAFYYIQSK